MVCSHYAHIFFFIINIIIIVVLFSRSLITIKPPDFKRKNDFLIYIKSLNLKEKEIKLDQRNI